MIYRRPMYTDIMMEEENFVQGIKNWNKKKNPDSEESWKDFKK